MTGDLDRTAPRASVPPVHVDAASPDFDLQLVVGESRELEMVSLGTAGFVWSQELEGDDGTVRLTRSRGRPFPPGPVGRSTTERLLITATAPGRALIRLRQARPWEAGTAPRASLRINVQVAG
jgi:predicted secreted protein